MKNILCWDKPERAMSKEKWASLSADGAPPGVYVPNMSDADAAKWKAKLVGTKVPPARVEIRKEADALVLIIVSLGEPYVYKYKRAEMEGQNVRISMNGPAAFTFEEFAEMQQAVAEAKVILEKWRDS